MSLSVYGEATDLYYHVGILGTDRETALAVVISWLSSVQGYRIHQDTVVEDPPLLRLNNVSWPSFLAAVEDRLQMVVSARVSSLLSGTQSETKQTDGTASENIAFSENAEPTADRKAQTYEPLDYLVADLTLFGDLADAHREELRFVGLEKDPKNQFNKFLPRNWLLPWRVRESELNKIDVRCVFHFLGARPGVDEIKNSITGFRDPLLTSATVAAGEADPSRKQNAETSDSENTASEGLEAEEMPSSASSVSRDQQVDAEKGDTTQDTLSPQNAMFCLATLDDFSLRTSGAIEALMSLNQLLKNALPTLPVARVMVACLDGSIRPAATLPLQMAPLDVVDFITEKPDKGERVLRDLWSDWPMLLFKSEYINMILSEWRVRRPTLTAFQHSAWGDGKCLRLATFDRLGLDKKLSQPGVILSSMNLQQAQTDEDSYERHFSTLFSDEVLPLRSIHIDEPEDRWSLESRRRKLGKHHRRWAPYRGWVPLMALFLGPSNVGNRLAKDWLFDDTIRNAKQ